jgi:hypothetical protein
MHFARLEHQRLIERLVFPAVSFTNKNAQQHGVMGEMHMKSLLLNGDGERADASP